MKIHNHTLPKAIRRHSIRRWLATATTMTAMLTATLATLTGCSADNDPETATGGDGTSVTFGATITAREAHDNGKASNNAPAPASRGIIDDTFEEGDRILVHIEGTLNAFVYRTTQGFVHDPGVTQPGIAPTPPVWESGRISKNVLAYGPMGRIAYDANDGYKYEYLVNNDQRTDVEYVSSDYVHAVQTLSRNNPKLTFRHGMARVEVRLRPGSTLTDEDVAGATVELGNGNLHLTADIDPQTGALTARVNPKAQTISPHRRADTPAGCAVAYEALLPPQDVGGKVFIRVRFADDTELAYSAESGSPLEGGYEYVYNVTVEENHLEVTMTGGDVPWQEGILTTKIDGKEFRLIRTAEDLARFARDVNGDGTSQSELTGLNALQTADINLQNLARSADPDLRKLAEDWVPIGSRAGNYASCYEGTYCGNGHTVSGLRIESDHGTGNKGLFGSVGYGALLTGIHLRDVRITGTIGLCNGTLAGYVSGGTVTLCSAEGTIEATLPGDGGIGGLVGRGSRCSINRCRTKVTIKADVTLQGSDRAYAGGIAGECYHGSSLFACRAEGEVSLDGTGTSTNSLALCAGGIAGCNSNFFYLEDSYIQACKATGNVSVTCTGTDAENTYAGGLVGYNCNRGYLRYSYARGTAIATANNAIGRAGAIVGGNQIGGNQKNGRTIDIQIAYCFGVGARGAGTSGVTDAVIIVYDESPGEGKIQATVGQREIIAISTTLYNPTATPAYGIRVSRRNLNVHNVWNTTNPIWIWPALDMEDNGSE